MSFMLLRMFFLTFFKLENRSVGGEKVAALLSEMVPGSIGANVGMGAGVGGGGGVELFGSADSMEQVCLQTRVCVHIYVCSRGFVSRSVIHSTFT